MATHLRRLLLEAVELLGPLFGPPWLFSRFVCWTSLGVTGGYRTLHTLYGSSRVIFSTQDEMYRV